MDAGPSLSPAREPPKARRAVSSQALPRRPGGVDAPAPTPVRRLPQVSSDAYFLLCLCLCFALILEILTEPILPSTLLVTVAVRLPFFRALLPADVSFTLSLAVPPTAKL